MKYKTLEHLTAYSKKEYNYAKMKYKTCEQLTASSKKEYKRSKKKYKTNLAAPTNTHIRIVLLFGTSQQFLNVLYFILE